VHGADDVVEPIERRVVVIEIAVRADVRFDAFQDPELSECRVQFVDLGIGFILSAVASYRLAGVLGLLSRAPDPSQVAAPSRL
jgi:hypothetical protein